MQLIEHYEVPSGGVSSMTFSSIPDTFTDLYVLMSLRDDSGFQEGIVGYRYNGSTSGYSGRTLWGSGSTQNTFALSTNTSSAAGGTWGRTSNLNINYTGTTANTFASNSLYIPNYRSNVAKSASLDGVTENNATEAWQSINALLWSGTDPITSISFAPIEGTGFVEYSTFTLFGILAGSDGIVAVS